MEKHFEKDVEKNILAFKAFQQLHLTEALDKNVALEMGLNKEDCGGRRAIVNGAPQWVSVS